MWLAAAAGGCCRWFPVVLLIRENPCFGVGSSLPYVVLWSGYALWPVTLQYCVATVMPPVLSMHVPVHA